MTQILQPLGHRVLVRLKKKEQVKEVKSEFGIILEQKSNKALQTEQEATCDAYIVAIGSTANKYLDSHDGTGETEYKVGDLVVIGKYAGRLMPDIYDQEEIYRLIKDNDINARYIGENIEMPEQRQLQEALEK
jgi:co-chaperonin GroES (HSP10)